MVVKQLIHSLCGRLQCQVALSDAGHHTRLLEGVTLRCGWGATAFPTIFVSAVKSPRGMCQAALDRFGLCGKIHIY